MFYKSINGKWNVLVGAGRGTLSVGVRAAGQDVKHSIRDLGGGLYKVLFYPRAPIPHKVDIRYNGVPVQGRCLSFIFYLFYLLYIFLHFIVIPFFCVGIKFILHKHRITH